MTRETFFQRVRQLPVMFPIIAVFHVLLFLYTVGYYLSMDVLTNDKIIVNCVTLLLYTLLWIGVCGLSKKAAIGYIVLTAIDLLLFFFQWGVGDSLLPFDVLLCVFLLFYYKRFR